MRYRWKERLAELPETLHLALPIMAGNVAQMLMGAIDTLMVGRLGVTELAACSFASSILSFLLLAGIGIMQPVSILGAQALGAGHPRELGEVLRVGLVIGAAAGLVVGVICSVMEGHLGIFRQAPAVEEEARGFLVIVGWSILPAILVTGLKQFAEALNRPWIPMLIIFAGVGVNAVLNWFLIFGNLGFPALGLEGAAWATLAARILTLLALAAWILRDRAFAAMRPVRWFGELVWRRVRTMIALGVPVSMQLMLEVGAFGLSAIFMGWVNAETLAAHQIVLTCAATTFMVPLGLSSAVALRAGNAWGAKDSVRVRNIGFSAFGLATVVMAIAALGLMLGRSILPQWFIEPSADGARVVAIAENLMIVAALFQLVDGIQIVGHGLLRGMGDVRVPTHIAFVAYWLLALPSGWLLAFVFHLEGVGIWTGLALGLGFAAVALVARFERMSRRSASEIKSKLTKALKL